MRPGPIERRTVAARNDAMRTGHFSLGYMPALDGIRALAVCAVMLFHSDIPLVSGGFIGVDIFFVLSGFLITSILLKEHEQTGRISLKDFYIRRSLRLLPALVALLLVFVAVSAVYGDERILRTHFIDALIVLFYSANWARAFDMHPPDYLGHAWSLSIEEQFYLLWPLILIAILRWRRSRRWRLFIILGMAFFAWGLRSYLLYQGASLERLYNGLDTRADALLVGCVVGVLLATPAFVRRMRRPVSLMCIKYLAPIAWVGLGWICIGIHWRSPHLYYWVQFLIEVLTALVIVDVVISPRSLVRGLLERKWLVWTGSISYGLYLWHYPIFRVLLSYGYSTDERLLFGSLLTFGVATLSFYFLERPILQKKKNFQTDLPSKYFSRDRVFNPDAT